MIRPALKSPVVNNRNMALSVLEEWMKTSGKTIQEISPNMAEYLKEILQGEVRDDIRQKIEQILNNRVAHTDGR